MSKRLPRNNYYVKQLLSQQQQCQHCGKGGKGLEVDHQVPLSQGGRDEPNNLVVLCKQCHRERTNRYRESLLATVSRQGKLKPATQWISRKTVASKPKGRGHGASRSRGW